MSHLHVITSNILRQLSKLKQYSINFVKYFMVNVAMTQTICHVPLHVLNIKKLILKTFYLIERITWKIIRQQFRVTTKSFVGNFYQFGGPVPHSSFERILELFNNGVVRNVNILLQLLARLCNINTILYYSRLFQRCIHVLCGVCQRIFHIRM